MNTLLKLKKVLFIFFILLISCSEKKAKQLETNFCKSIQRNDSITLTKELEDVAFSFGGVQKAYAIQAGRELRVIVESEKVDDTKAAELSFNITQKIQNATWSV